MDNERIIEALDRIADAIDSNEWVTILISIIAIIAPLILTIISICLSIRMDKNNKDLQRQIHNRDVDNQTRQLFMDIYSSFSKATNTAINLKKANELLAFNTDNRFYNDLCSAGQEMEYSFDKFKLLNDGTDNDKRLLGYLSDYIDAYSDLYNEITNYLQNPLYKQHIDDAWAKAATHGILYPNFFSIMLNSNFKNEFIAFFKDQYTDTISQKAEKVTSIFQQEELAQLFIEHIKIKKI